MARAQVSRPVLKRIESFLVGDSPSPEVFFGLQESAARTLRELHFPAFVASPKCRRMIEEAAAAGVALGYFYRQNWEDVDSSLATRRTPAVWRAQT